MAPATSTSPTWATTGSRSGLCPSEASTNGRRLAGDLPLRRSFRDGRSGAAFLVRASLVVVWLPLNVRGSRPVLARGWHVVHLSTASSSRSQVAARAASAMACPTWERPSADVRCVHR
jgi:hypothetical protein